MLCALPVFAITDIEADSADLPASLAKKQPESSGMTPRTGRGPIVSQTAE